jgi:hypothetical protein
MSAKRNRYEEAAAALVVSSGVTVRKYRERNTGVAFTTADDWGIEVPHPRGPISFATFAHEVGHQLLHRHNSTPRWLEEIEAWEFALSCFERFELSGVERARHDAAKSLVYAAVKALRNPRTSDETRRALRSRYAWVWQTVPEQALRSEIWL